MVPVPVRPENGAAERVSLRVRPEGPPGRRGTPGGRYPALRRAAARVTVLLSSMAMVSGPTPPGTGV